MAKAEGNWANGGHHWYSIIYYGIESQTSTQAVIYCDLYFHSLNYGFDIKNNTADQITINGQPKSQSKVAIYVPHGTTADVKRLSYSVTVKKSTSPINVKVSGTCTLNAADIGSSTASGTVTVPAIQYDPAGQPSIQVSNSTPKYNENIFISWKKATKQGNGPFKQFQLYRGSVNIYTGNDTSITDNPSVAVGTNGGFVTYTIWQGHTWNGSTQWTKSDISVGVGQQKSDITAYDSSGKKHVGRVTAYDSSGKSHSVIITVYDNSRVGHSVR